MVNFEDTATAFITKSNAQLKKAYYMFKIVANPSLVSFGKKASAISMGLGLPIRGLVKKTVYDQFVGGENILECDETIDKLNEHNVKCLLDYSVEGKVKEEDFENTKNILIQTIKYGKNKEAIPFTVFKVTGLARFSLLEKVSRNAQLNSSEEKEWFRVQKRVEQICQTAYDVDLAVLIDAEESWIQNAIDGLAEEMIRKFNEEKVVIYNTLQMYRKDRLNYLKNQVEEANKVGYYLGVKLVRGAYMEKERERALKNNIDSPIQETKADTDRDYDAGVKYIVDNLRLGAIVAGTHNENSCKKLVDAMLERGLPKNDERVWFSQLFGMSDNLSFNLAKDGYNVVKYLPFGPVKETLPYLIRRAEENTAAAGQTSRELDLIKKEMQRRGLKS
tara:strand:- start:3132 stop:4301 length:1170 start_codon:yes stop_codon:yes gene_type:complete